MNPIKIKKNVLFIGANDMCEVSDYINDYQNGLFIEAIPNVFNQLVQNLNFANINYNTNYIPINSLVSYEPDIEYNFNILNNNGASSSIYEPNPTIWKWPNTHQTGVLKLKSTTVELILKEYKWENIQYDLILDVQGAELDVLKGFGEHNFNNIRKITTEISTEQFYKNAVLFDDLNKFIINLGFKLDAPPENNHCDVTYTRINI